MSKQYFAAVFAALGLALAAGPAAAQQAKPIDHMTAFMVYHKMTGEPIDYDEIVRQLLRVQSTRAEQRAQLHAKMVAELRQAYENADPEAAYVIATGTQMRYVHGSGRLEVPLFSGDSVFQMNPFEQQGDWLMPGAERRARYRRSLQFVNFESARFVQVADERMQPVVLQQVQPYSDYNVVAEVVFRFVDAVPHHEEWRKSLRIMVESVRYRYRGGGAIAQRWPLTTNPIPVAAVEVASPTEGPRSFDDVVGFYLYHKAAGTTPDFAALSQLTQAVAIAPQFEKAAIASREAERMRGDFEGVDPEATYRVNLESMLVYDLEQEQFKARSLEPGRVMHIRPLGGLGADRRHASGASELAWRHQVVLDNMARYEFIPLPRDLAAAMPEVYQRGEVLASLGIEMKVAGTGPATRDAPGGTLLMAIQAIHLQPMPPPRGSAAAAVNWPFREPIVR